MLRRGYEKGRDSAVSAFLLVGGQFRRLPDDLGKRVFGNADALLDCYAPKLPKQLRVVLVMMVDPYLTSDPIAEQQMTELNGCLISCDVLNGEGPSSPTEIVELWPYHTLKSTS